MDLIIVSLVSVTEVKQTNKCMLRVSSLWLIFLIYFPNYEFFKYIFLIMKWQMNAMNANMKKYWILQSDI